MSLVKIFLMSLLILITSCNCECRIFRDKYSESSNYFLDTNIKITEVIEKILSLIPGDITKIEKKFKNNSPVWNIDMIYGEGSTFSFEISVTENKITEITANEGPYEYEIKPEGGLIPFSEARKTAEQHTSQKVLKWNLKQVKEKYEYSFWLFIKSGKAQVRVDAVTGEIITKSKKTIKKSR